MNKTEQIQLVYMTLFNKYKKQVINKKELAQELGISESCINYRMSISTGLPSYIKGSGECGKVGFSLICVAEFIVENNIKVT